MQRELWPHNGYPCSVKIDTPTNFMGWFVDSMYLKYLTQPSYIDIVGREMEERILEQFYKIRFPEDESIPKIPPST